jgi:hypothetical protein
MTYCSSPALILGQKREGVTPNLFVSEWFTTLFSINFPPSTTVKIWDLLFVEGIDYLFKVALGIMELSQGTHSSAHS